MKARLSAFEKAVRRHPSKAAASMAVNNNLKNDHHPRPTSRMVSGQAWVGQLIISSSEQLAFEQPTYKLNSSDVMRYKALQLAPTIRWSENVYAIPNLRVHSMLV